jgi:hypothetical protein
MKVVTINFPDGSGVLVTTYDTGEVTGAKRDKDWHSWGPPAVGTVEPEYNYETGRHIEDVLTEGWKGL